MTNTHDIDFINYLKNMGVERRYIRDTKELNGDVNKITICARDGFDGETYEYFYNKWAGKAHVSISSPEQMYITMENMLQREWQLPFYSMYLIYLRKIQ